MHTSQGGPGKRAHATKTKTRDFHHDFSPLTQVYAAGTVLGGWLAALANSHELLTCTRQGHLSHKQRSPQKDSITDVTSHKMRLLQTLPCILYAPSAISSSTSNTAIVRLTMQPAIPFYYDFFCFAVLSFLSCVLQTMPVALWVGHVARAISEPLLTLVHLPACP